MNCFKLLSATDLLSVIDWLDIKSSHAILHCCRAFCYAMNLTPRLSSLQGIERNTMLRFSSTQRPTMRFLSPLLYAQGLINLYIDLTHMRLIMPNDLPIDEFGQPVTTDASITVDYRSIFTTISNMPQLRVLALVQPQFRHNWLNVMLSGLRSLRCLYLQQPNFIDPLWIKGGRKQQPIDGVFSCTPLLRSLRLDETSANPFIEVLHSEAPQLRRLELTLKAVSELEDRRLHSLLVQSPQLQVVIRKATRLGSPWKLQQHLSNIARIENGRVFLLQ